MPEQQIVFSGKEITEREPNPDLINGTYMIPLSQLAGFKSIPLDAAARAQKAHYIPGRDDPAYLETNDGKRFVLVDPLDRVSGKFDGSKGDFFINLVTDVNTFRDEVPKVPAGQGSEELVSRMSGRLAELNR